jgi:signal transduction histidine kinase
MEKTETQLQRASQKEAIDAISGEMIHEINNILSSILGYADLAKMGLKTGANVEKDLDQVLNAGLRARSLVSQLLDFILQAGIRTMPIEAALLIKETVKHLRPLLPAAIEISFHSGDFKGKILADPVQFHRILIILCLNAAHAKKKKSGLIEISLKDKGLSDKNVQQHIDLKSGKYLRLNISDRGNGMPKEILESLSAPFCIPAYKADAFPGLSLVQGIVREMGGDISVCSRSQKGSIFNIYFPKYEKESGEEAYGAIIDYR